MAVMVNNVNQATEVYLILGSSNSQSIFHRTILEYLVILREENGEGGEEERSFS